MPTIRIYKGNVEVGSKKFDVQFMIFRTQRRGHRLFWRADEEETEVGGEILIWIRSFGRFSETGKLRFDIGTVRPSWHLIVDGVSQERGLYSDFEVTGKDVELQHEDYRFVCSFFS